MPTASLVRLICTVTPCPHVPGCAGAGMGWGSGRASRPLREGLAAPLVGVSGTITSGGRRAGISLADSPAAWLCLSRGRSYL